MSRSTWLERPPIAGRHRLGLWQWLGWQFDLPNIYSPTHQSVPSQALIDRVAKRTRSASSIRPKPVSTPAKPDPASKRRRSQPSTKGYLADCESAPHSAQAQGPVQGPAGGARAPALQGSRGSSFRRKKVRMWLDTTDLREGRFLDTEDLVESPVDDIEDSLERWEGDSGGRASAGSSRVRERWDSLSRPRAASLDSRDSFANRAWCRSYSVLDLTGCELASDGLPLNRPSWMCDDRTAVEDTEARPNLFIPTETRPYFGRPPLPPGTRLHFGNHPFEPSPTDEQPPVRQPLLTRPPGNSVNEAAQERRRICTAGLD